MIRRTTPLFLAAVILTAATPAPARAADPPMTKVAAVEGITEYRLPNGLRVVLYPDASKPLVTVNMTVLVGGRHEGYGEGGMAHLLEHMLFKGTPTFKDIPRALRDRGARFQGTTNFDRTNYYETMPASDDNLEFAIKLEADRLVNSSISREDLITEMTVVRNEFEMGENDQQWILGQRMAAAAYDWHNYGKSFIGNRSDIERVPVERLQAFYKKHYRVDNVVLIITGQFDETKALDLVARHFGPLKPPAQKLEKLYTQEPAQDGERQVVLRRVGSVAMTGVAYHVPAITHPDMAAIDILTECLTSQPGGRLYKALIEAKKASSVSGNSVNQYDPWLLQIFAKVEDPKGVDAAREALIDTLENLAKNPITDQEVARAKRVFAVSNDRAVTDSEQVATVVSECAAIGDWRLFFVHRDRLEQVTAADVNRVAQKYLVRSNRTVGTYYPTQKPERADIPDAPRADELVKDYKGRAAKSAGEAFDPTPAALDRRVVRGSLGPIRTAFLPKKTVGGLATVQLTLRYGHEQSLADNVLAAELLPYMLTYGTTTHTRQQLVDEMDRLGAGMLVTGGAGDLTVTVQAKRANLPAALRLAGEVLRRPTFPESELGPLRAAMIERQAARKTDPEALAAAALDRKLNDFPKGNIRRKPTPDELTEGLKGVTVAQVKALYEQQLGAQAGELVAIGDFDPQEVTDVLGPVLAGWTSAVPYRRVENAATPVAKGAMIVIDTPGKENAVYMAGLAFAMDDADSDYPALSLGNYILGASGLSSRLTNRVRRESGLSYGIESSLFVSSRDKVAAFEVTAIANPANIGKVDALVAEELGRFLKDGVTADELAAARKAYLELRKGSRSDDSGLLGELGFQASRGRTFQSNADFEAKVAALTPADIQRAFRRVVDPKKLVIVHAGDFKMTK